MDVKEHQKADLWVAQVRAQDYDSDQNKHVSFFVANEDPVPFTVDPFSGEIRTTKSLDYETERRVWKLKVRVSDMGTPFSRQSQKVIVIR